MLELYSETEYRQSVLNNTICDLSECNNLEHLLCHSYGIDKMGKPVQVTSTTHTKWLHRRHCILLLMVSSSLYVGHIFVTRVLSGFVFRVVLP